MKKIKFLLCIYAIFVIVYGSICFLKYAEDFKFTPDLPKIEIDIIKVYPDFEGAKH